MRTFRWVIVLLLAITTLSFAHPALAQGNPANGAGLFQANCAACHLGGKNVVNPAKTLQKSDLEKYGMLSLEAIKTQITKGKAAMPAFLGKLNEQQIEDVAAYVLAQAEKGW
ncbi:cytochrome c6 PetJ [Spirulina subsalsa]|uniref:cytochrome c6 PetJ n=1 Tax=Spirulina subsalsa TaxID=54311 RepID=UPI00030F7696|nr:c-type cytochrome [Spirulina subsalsa]